MVKRLFELFGLATMGVGIYFIVSEQGQNNACNAINEKYVGLGMTTQCQHVVYAYFGGFVLLALGVVVVVFGMLATRKAAKRRLRQGAPSLASQYHSINPTSSRTPQA
jgi:hypothetical protein